jgi:hypothetical protein
MVRQLGQKPSLRNNHPLLAHRLATAANGYVQTPVREKKGCKGWPRLACDAKAIRSHKQWRNEYWDGTGIRISHDLTFLDLDIKSQEVADEIIAMVRDLDPAAWERTIRRSSGAVSLAVAWRSAEAFGQLNTATYTAHPELLPALEAARAMPVQSMEDYQARGQAVHDAMQALEPQHVEIFGPKAKRLFQVDGRHSGEGDTARFYRIDSEQAPWNTPLTSLPLLPLPAHEIISRAESILKARLTPIPMENKPSGGVVYDLKPTTQFYPKGELVSTVAELADSLEWGAENGLYGCLPETLDSQSQANCHLYVTISGRITVVDFKHGERKHYMASDAPPPSLELDDDARASLAAALGAAPAGEPQSSFEADPGAHTPPDEVLRFLQRNFAIERESGKVVDLRETDCDRALKDKEAFTTIYAPFRFYVPARTDKGKGTWVPVTEAWRIHAERLTVEAVRFRPDKPFPLYQEGGKTYKNVYRRPVHSGDANLGPLLDDFMPVFIPDPEQRKYVLDVVAHRWCHPAIPGPSLIFVAFGAVDPMKPDFGTGRSAWFDFEARLFGEDYVSNESFRVVSGQSGQGDFTAWKAFRRLVTIDEAQTTIDSNSFKGGYSSYETLKMVADPTPRRRTFTKKFKQPFTDYDFAPMDIASNHQGAIHMPDNDRRFAVIENGRPLTPAEARSLHAFTRAAGAPAAFARWCERRDLSRFDPYAPPPVFSGKQRMQELSASEIDRAMATFALFCKAKKIEMFVKSHVEKFVRKHMDTPPEFGDLVFKGRFEAVFRHSCTRLGANDNDIRARPCKGAEQERVYVFGGANKKKLIKQGLFVRRVQIETLETVVAQFDIATAAGEAIKAWRKSIGLVGADDLSHDDMA